MPELPEVETVRLKLLSTIKNKTILNVEVFYSKYDILKSLKNEKILDINRLGKFLIFNLEHFTLISHLRMEGKYRVETSPVKDKHDHVFFNLDSGETLVYNDKRKFGVFYLFDKNVDIYKVEPLLSVGKEPFTITKEELFNKINNKSLPIKSLLLDQSIISGIGNIYADEVLFVSNIHPLRLGKTISLDECESIINNSVRIMSNSIKSGGTTIRSFESFNGEPGHFQGSLSVHLKEGKRCPNCGNFIKKIRVGGRGTYLCEACQRIRDYKLIGLTGTFASGKSTVLKIINDLGYMTISLDDIYNDLFINNEKMRKEIFKHFNTLDKSILRELIYNEKCENEILKEITHKYIFYKMFEMINESKDKYIFVEAPLLYEDNYEKMFDKVIVVSPSESVEKVIMSERHITKETYDKVMESQLSDKDKCAKADFIIKNDSSLDSLKEKVKNTLKEVL